MHTVAHSDPPAPTTRASTWLLAGAPEPTELVDRARAAFVEGCQDPDHWGVRRDAAYRRYGAEGGRPGLTAPALEAARRGLDRHRAHLHLQRSVDLDTLAEISHRSSIPADFGPRDLEVPAWFKCEGSDGATIVPRRLWPFLALQWWAYARGRFGVLASTVELAAHFGVAPRTIRIWRADAVRQGLTCKGEHVYTDEAGVERPHCEAIRTWRPGHDTRVRPCDRDRNIYRLGPVLEAFAWDAVGGKSTARAPSGRGGARRAARDARKASRALRRAARVASYRRTGEHWDREVARLPPVEGTRRGAAPVAAERLARSAVTAPRSRPRLVAPPAVDASTEAPAQPQVPRPQRDEGARASKVIARIKDPCTPVPSGPSGERGEGPRTPGASSLRSHSAGGSRSSPSATAAAPPRGPDATSSRSSPSATWVPPDTPLRPGAQPGGGASGVPGRRAPPPPRAPAARPTLQLVPERGPPAAPDPPAVAPEQREADRWAATVAELRRHLWCEPDDEGPAGA